MVEIDEPKLVARGGIVGAFKQAATNVEIWLSFRVGDHWSAVSSANDRGDAYLGNGPFLDIIILGSWRSHD